MTANQIIAASLFASLSLAVPAGAQFHAGDIGLRVPAERIETGAFDASTGVLAPIRVFGGTFG
ncbi:MAG: hypothetical protein ACO38P_11410, partial [Phycisphaerales bacterium]